MQGSAPEEWTESTKQSYELCPTAVSLLAQPSRIQTAVVVQSRTPHRQSGNHRASLLPFRPCSISRIPAVPAAPAVCPLCSPFAGFPLNEILAKVGAESGAAAGEKSLRRRDASSGR